MTLIKKGSRDAIVTELQNILRELDYNIPVTGYLIQPRTKPLKTFKAVILINIIFLLKWMAK